MSYSDETLSSELEELKGTISSLESRIKDIEKHVGIDQGSELIVTFGDQDIAADTSTTDQSAPGRSFLETRIGEYGLAWMGNLVLLFGITFFTGYLQGQGLLGTSTLLGYLCVATILFLSRRIEKAFPHMGFVLFLNGNILLYYITLKLHYFSDTIWLGNEAIALILLIMVILVQIYLAVKLKSQTLFGLAIILGLFTAIVGESTHFMLPIATLISATATFFMFRFSWKKAMILSIIMVYITYLIWFLNNPIMGNPYGAIEDQHYGIVYLFIIAAIYSLVALARKKDNILEGYAGGVIILSGFWFSVILAICILQFYSQNYIVLFSAIASFCIVYSIVLKTFSKWKFTSASYALYGFVAMSIALFGIFGLPNLFLLLALQSLVVVSFALWFRNKIIVIMNALLLISLLFIYLVVSDPVDGVNFSFAIATLLTARILNWKKERLEIQTDILRNIYLILGFILVLYAIFHSAPTQYITLGWSAAALIYFLLSIVLKNKKYRYLSLGTLIAATIYLLFIDLAKIDILFRVSALLFVAFISIGISIYYSKKKT